MRAAKFILVTSNSIARLMTGRFALRIIVLLLAAGALLACDYNHRRSYVEPTYRPGVFNYAAGGRDLTVETIGNPFVGRGVGDQDFPDVITASMQGRNLGQATNFTATPGVTARPQYKVVIAFNPIEPATYRALCEGEVRSGPTEESIRVKAAFCQGGRSSGQRVLTGVRANVIAEAGPDSEAFRKMMAGITRDLFPLWDNDFDDDCRGMLLLCH